MKTSWALGIVLTVTLLAPEAPAGTLDAHRETGSSSAAAQDPGAGYLATQAVFSTSGGGGGTMGNPDYPSGTSNTGSHCDDCTTLVNFPFPVKFYGETYNSAYVSSNGNVQFTGNSPSASNACLPNPDFGAAIFAFQTDLRTNSSDFSDQILTGVSGVAPGRLFTIDFHLRYFNSADQAHFAIYFQEGADFRVAHYSSTDNGASAVLGVQASATGPYTQYSCQTASQGLRTEVTYRPIRTLTVSKTGSGSGTVTSAPAGIDCGSTCSHQYAEGAAPVLSAQASSGSVFTGWSGGGCSGTGTCTLDMHDSREVSANFVLSRSVTVTKAGTGSGTVTSSPGGIDCGATCAGPFAEGTAVTLTAEAAPGSVFTGWSEDCTGTGDCSLQTDQDHAATATFELQSCPGFENDPRIQIVGTPGDDILEGTAQANIICGLGGNDDINGKGKGDLLLGGGGVDQITGAGGGDVAKGGGGNDWMSGKSGKDRLNGGKGKDVAVGGDGRDFCRAELKKTCEA
jgi:hypothetical protein